MPKNILVMHHIEPMWQACFDNEYLESVITYLKRYGRHYYKVIFATLEGDSIDRLACDGGPLEDWWYELAQLLTNDFWVENQDWSYAFERGQLDAEDEAKNLIDVPTVHETAYLYPWIRELKYSSGHIAVMGGHRDECLADLQYSLEHLSIKYRTIDNLVYG